MTYVSTHYHTIYLYICIYIYVYIYPWLASQTRERLKRGTVVNCIVNVESTTRVLLVFHTEIPTFYIEDLT